MRPQTLPQRQSSVLAESPCGVGLVCLHWSHNVLCPPGVTTREGSVRNICTMPLNVYVRSISTRGKLKMHTTTRIILTGLGVGAMLLSGQAAATEDPGTRCYERDDIRSRR